MYILDTDTITHLHAGNSKVVENLKVVNDSDIRITVITKIELLRGRFEFLLKASDKVQLLKAQELLYRTEELLMQIPTIGVDDKSAFQFEKLLNIKKLNKIGRADILIASIALANNAVLVTRNLKHFRQIAGLFVTNWVD
ncbi:MAG: PIN domain-containing protein [Desulfobacterales bacterium]|nr:PIN domain-containing protein [Desulfobacterales bacterium]